MSWGRISHWQNLELALSVSLVGQWAARVQMSLLHLVLVLQTYAATLRFLPGAGDMNSNPHAWPVSSWLPEPFPQPSFLVFLRKSHHDMILDADVSKTHLSSYDIIAKEAHVPPWHPIIMQAILGMLCKHNKAYFGLLLFWSEGYLLIFCIIRGTQNAVGSL